MQCGGGRTLWLLCIKAWRRFLLATVVVVVGVVEVVVPPPEVVVVVVVVVVLPPEAVPVPVTWSTSRASS